MSHELYPSSGAKTTGSLEDQALALAEHRARCELELLANLAPGLGQGFQIVDELGIGPDQFAEPDTTAIFSALGIARKYPDDIQRARLVKRALQHIGLWDDGDERSFIGSMRWGPGPLACLMCRLSFDKGRLALAACNLLCAIEDQNTFERTSRQGVAA